MALKPGSKANIAVPSGALLLSAAGLLLGRSPAGSTAGLVAGIAGSLLVGLGFAAVARPRAGAASLGAVGALTASLASFTAAAAGALVLASALLDASWPVDLAMMLLVSSWLLGSAGLIVYGYAVYQGAGSPTGQLYMASALLLLAAPLVGSPIPAFVVLAAAGASGFKPIARGTDKASTTSISGREDGG
ncbi:hypothetical protein [Pyrodictium abyssi]|uniref:Uncharacterized protein n=1 Tax=Pyrodictium abyssi TaxID=54256 RepID=A0ABM8IYS7_9CREN|nr:hypothetical protein PABY_22630 [Pyrodictium abyssi]